MSDRQAAAVILAAGCGRRLGAMGSAQPKCLLRFGGSSLIERHLTYLSAAGVRQAAIVVGFEHSRVEAEVRGLDIQPAPQLIYNSRHAQGSLLSVWSAREWLMSGSDIILMDADVLYSPRALGMLTAPATGRSAALMDRLTPASDCEAVKLCVAHGRIVELAKELSRHIAFDAVGESLGLFRLSPATARQLAHEVERRLRAGRDEEPYEPALRDVLVAAGKDVDVHDVTGLPWIEIDFPEDVARAEREILPRITRERSSAAAEAAPDLSSGRSAPCIMATPRSSHVD